MQSTLAGYLEQAFVAGERAAADADADARDMCSECGHSRDSHKEQYAGICIGCPCTGWEEPHREE